MGSMQAQEMAALADIDTALRWHLQCNHYPAVPLTMLPVCKQAIESCNDGESGTLIDLPEGTSYRGEDQAPAWAIVEGHHLDAFLYQDEDEDTEVCIAHEPGNSLWDCDCTECLDLQEQANDGVGE